MNVVPILAIVTGLTIVNTVTFLCELNPRISNVAFLVSAGFFVLSQLPRNLVGFALAVRDWGDKWRNCFGDGASSAPPYRERRWAAHRSFIALSLFVLVGFVSMLIRARATGELDQTDASFLAGMSSGFFAAYVAVLGRRDRAS
ncbi:hypothetical protein [Dyella sp. C11]|uniref:hypothetical protein n=1 Tax=Dyella sp. C11 TaxID=2126991 RepID=UPI000D65D897|nr:hypothetical protein [Dyella sp. C11]